jgi:hypothetical protein
MSMSFYVLKTRNKRLASFLAVCQYLLSEVMAFSFIPPQLDCDNDCKDNDLDEVSALWESLWSSVGHQLSSRYPFEKKKVDLVTSSKIMVVKLCAVRRSLLVHACINAASSQMLTCYRNAGEPAYNSIIPCSVNCYPVTFFNKIIISKCKSTASNITAVLFLCLVVKIK